MERDLNQMSEHHHGEAFLVRAHAEDGGIVEILILLSAGDVAREGDAILQSHVDTHLTEALHLTIAEHIDMPVVVTALQCLPSLEQQVGSLVVVEVCHHQDGILAVGIVAVRSHGA